ncbi:NADPH dehydrogenase [Mycoplasma todarodis]|uniref:NADPH dehydrogenase n=1 Tax=Mycoplasma todarodis TaxID=1937191 RepID=A0A4R0XQV7_9MOLU|nr:NADPH dehydrogenase [Mycoplasma todarodis]TCG11979.1 NADPH dehydrogenase [Mycoplasma todarodis]
MNKWNKEVELKTITLKNKVAMAPMCTYVSKDGFANSFHVQHYSSRAWGNVGLIIQESTGVSKVGGKIDNRSLSIHNDELAQSYKPIVEAVHDAGSKIFVQLSHAGPRNEVKGESYSASEVKLSDKYEKAMEMTIPHIQEVIQDFVEAAKRAEAIGYDGIEIHGAHGYLLNSFISPTINDRDDKYGVDRFLIVKEIIRRIKKEVSIPVGIRISAFEWAIDLPNSTIQDFVKGLKPIEEHLEYIHVSTGGVLEENIDVKGGLLYQIPFAEEIKKEFPNTPIMGVGLILNNDLLEEVVSRVDLAALGRTLLKNPMALLDWQTDFDDDVTPRVYQVMNGGKSPWVE